MLHRVATGQRDEQAVTALAYALRTYALWVGITHTGVGRLALAGGCCKLILVAGRWGHRAIVAPRTRRCGRLGGA